MKYLALSISLLLAACATTTTRPIYVTPPPHPAPVVQQTASVITVYEEPPMSQPAPIAIRWAPPPMLVEVPPPSSYPGAVWVGGYWTWNGTWVWAHGHWAQPPRSGYYWVHPYYENRNGEVVFVTGYWSPPEAVFIPPPPTVHITVARVAPNIPPGPQPIGPSGVFVPAPPGSRAGIIVPAPIGTPPAVVTSAPSVVNVGMHIEHNVNVHNTTINQSVTNNISNVHNVSNITNVTIVAPPSAVANGQAVKTVVPAQAHLAAALHPVVNMPVPKPVTDKPILPDAAAGASAVTVPTLQTSSNAHVQHFEAPYHDIMTAPHPAPVHVGSEPLPQAKSFMLSPLPQPVSESLATPRHLPESRVRIDAASAHAHTHSTAPLPQHEEAVQKTHRVASAQHPLRPEPRKQKEQRKNQHNGNVQEGSAV